MNIAEEIRDKSGNNLVERIRQGDEQAFEKLFCEYYYDLCSFAYQFTSCEERAKDLVQDVFVKIWNRREKWKVHRSVKAYLLKAVRNTAINHINERGHRSEVRENFSREMLQDIKPSVDLGVDKKDELVDQIWEAVVAMPKRRRRVFILYHRHGLSYDEISGVLDISRKTVENHMGLALKDIRAQIG
ncbi:RNA polymerase sigma-70 factor [Fodinibius sp.]|uniref:RNA polymerase sigma-70 factor n=1 Tax=Fodinibius sp. TaxID=1872440 RepID=UPI002ACDB6A7|nr:RNA polymerase sigma-70 factor [Fodinibius sp.]MDZ7658618.1 RNA polymerase sigma-70 factor [Fodinibius sp.]